MKTSPCICFALVAGALLLPPSASAVPGESELRVALAGGTLVAGTRATPAGRTLALRLENPAGAAIELPQPLQRRASLVDGPLPFTAGGELVGLAWLEGESRESYGVRFAPWLGAGWGEVEEISAPGPGSQLALAGVRLADGRLLLVWAAYDGSDDEIVAALRVPDGRWSEPTRIAEDNDTPDITPAVTAVGTGALVAWSRYAEGEYRVAVARFDGERFRPARWAGPAGSLFPSFVPAAETPRLLFRNARPAGWTVTELDRSGETRRTAFFETVDRARPAVRVDGATVELSWGEQRLESGWR